MALTQVQPGMLASDSQYTGFKNRIINGGQVINQRNATVTTGSTFVTDRWQVDNISTSGAVSFAQSSTAPAGFTNSLKITVTSADAAVGATDLVDFRQWIEGYNIADFNFGLSSAVNFTISFWVNSSVTGTYGVSFRNSATDQIYVSTYTVNSANTWEYKTITVTGDTAGTWLTDNSRGLGVSFAVMAGSNYQGTAGSWGSTNNRTTSAQANLLATLNNTFYITGVQLEKGSTATSFDYRPYGTELSLCQRYAWVYSGNSYAYARGPILNVSTTSTIWYTQYPTTMRAAPSLSLNNITSSTIEFSNYTNGSSPTYSSSVFNESSIWGGAISFATTGSTFTAGGVGNWRWTGAPNANFTFSAEL